MIRTACQPVFSRLAINTRGAIRSQGTVAISRHANEQMNSKSSHSKRPTAKVPANINSTIYHGESHDFSSVALKRDDGDYYFEAHAEALFSALNSYQQQQVELPPTSSIAGPALFQTEMKPYVDERVTASAYEMDLIEASHAARDTDKYDKILILMRHGEAKHNAFERNFIKMNEGKKEEEANLEEDYPVDPLLTGKGCGQMQTVSRRTATFFNKETSLQPDLVVVSPLRRAIQSAIIAFPTHTTLTSLTNIPWVCHPLCMERANGNKSEFVSPAESLEELFPGIDYDLYRDIVGDGDEVNRMEKVPLFESKIDLMKRTNEFLKWIQSREERVIVVSSHATWLHSFCAFSLKYEPENKGLNMFKKGEMRSVGIKFD